MKNNNDDNDNDDDKTDNDDNNNNNDTDTDKGEDDVVYYFNNAGQAPLSLDVQNIGIKIIAETPPWDDNNHKYAQSSQKRIRTLFSTLIGDIDNDNDIDNNNNESSSSGSRIAIVPSTAFAITLAARNIQRIHYLQQRDGSCDGRGRIIVLQDQFDSAVYPWQQICEESDGKIALDIVEYPPSSEISELCVVADGYEGTTSRWTKAVLQKLFHNNNNN
ncbi:hypothetical protein FRACYDRAFT_219462, partial [Fragilariopsis cylindrus CCMP1102]